MTFSHWWELNKEYYRNKDPMLAALSAWLAVKNYHRIPVLPKDKKDKAGKVIKVWHWEECAVCFNCPFCEKNEIILAENGDSYTCFCGAYFKLDQRVIVKPP